jgi:hypothetical protein
MRGQFQALSRTAEWQMLFSCTLFFARSALNFEGNPE